MALHSWVCLQWMGPCLPHAHPNGHWQNPLLGIDPLRESCLEMLITLPLRWKWPTKEACLALARAVDYISHFYTMPIAGKHHCTQSETRSGSTGIKSLQLTQWRNWTTSGSVHTQWTRSYPKVHTNSNYHHHSTNPLCILSHPAVTLHWETISEPVQCDPAPPVIHDGVKEYEVEHILDSWVFWGKIEYLVHWKRYGIEEDEWRPCEDFKCVSETHFLIPRWNPKAPNTSLPFTSPNSFLHFHQLHRHPRHSPLGLGYQSMHIRSWPLWGGGENVRVCSI